MEMNLEDLSREELIDLNHRVIERLKLLDRIEAHEAMMKLSIGQKVSFQPRGHPRLIGTVVKYNRKTVSVITENGQKWNVGPYLLTPVEETNETEVDNVISIRSKKKRRKKNRRRR